MRQKKSVYEHCEDNILYIPQALYGMRDVKPLLGSRESVIFYKDLDHELLNIEFHTNMPCMVYIKAGNEWITSCYNDTIELAAGEAIFLPKGLNLYSDYTNEGGDLQAFLLFFDDKIVSEFLSTRANIPEPLPNEKGIHKIHATSAINIYFDSLYATHDSLHNSAELLRLKLLELLHLIDIHDPEHTLRKSLSAVPKGQAKRNIRRLMEHYVVSDLTAKDFASLSGRSVSTFNREFKKLYHTTPKQWLIEKRLEHAHKLLVDKQWSVTAAANEVGYENISHFIKAFKNKFKITPHQIKSSI